jgi:hypothetical protein
MIYLFPHTRLWKQSHGCVTITIGSEELLVVPDSKGTIPGGVTVTFALEEIVISNLIYHYIWYGRNTSTNV